MRSLSVSRQLWILVAAFVVLITASLAGMSWLLATSSQSNQNLIARADVQNAESFRLLRAVAAVQSGTQRIVREKDPDRLEKLLEEVKNAGAEARRRLTAAGATGTDLESAFETLLRTNEGVTAALLKGEYAQSQQLFIESSNPAFDALLDRIVAGGDESRKRTQAQAADVRTGVGTRQTALYLVTLTAVICLVAFAVLLVRRMTESLNAAIIELSAGSEQTKSASAQVASAAHALAQGSGQQAASLEETSAAAEQVGSMTQRNAESSRSAAELMSETGCVVDRTNTKLNELLASMQGIQASSNKISKIIRVIDEIAFQTNILALNASVEAARAGEAGMGFAVVADEVRNLAHRCAEAARDTTTLIEESMGKTVEGNARLDEVAQSFRSILERASKTRQYVDEVSASSQQQASGMKEIARTMGDLEQLTQRNAASAEQSAAAAEQLSAQSNALGSTVASLRVLINGHSM